MHLTLNLRPGWFKITVYVILYKLMQIESQEIGIEEHYTKPSHFDGAAELSRRRNILYDNYLEIIEKVFISYREFFEDTHEAIRTKQHERSCFVRQFKQFQRKFSEIVKDTSIFQIDCLTETRVSRQDIILDCSRAIVEQCKKIQKPQAAFHTKLKHVRSLKEETSKQQENLKIESDDPLLYYNPKLMMGKVKSISEKVSEIKDLEASLKKEKENISLNANDFEKYLLLFRKRLLQNKYNMLMKMNEQSKNTQGCLTEIMLFLFQCAQSKMQAFAELVKNPANDNVLLAQSKGRARKGEDIDIIINNLINSIEEYNRTIDELEGILKCFDQGFKKMQTKIATIMEKQKPVFMENLNSLYSIDESPSKQVNETLDLVLFFSTKLSSISDKLYVCCTKLSMLRNNVKKHSDITLSLLKMNHKGKNDPYPQIDQLYNQISYDFLVQVIQEVYRAYKQVLTDLKNHFCQKYYKKKKHQIQDSMEISHIQESMFVPKKRPCKKQLWLWRDWRDKTNYVFSPSTAWVKKMQQFLSSFKQITESKQLNKFECVGGKKEARGVLKVCQKSLEFVSFSGSSQSNLQIPFLDISSVEVKVKIFQKVIAVETEKGEIVFSKILDVESAKSLINEIMQKNTRGAPKLKKKTMIELTPQETAFLQANKQDRENKRQKLDGMMKISQIFVDNLTIDQVYDVIYSDKTFTLRGKPEDSFFAYVMKKNKNFNYSAGAYDKHGPQFYTGDPQVKFNTCPIFSTRVNQFDHPIPPIPFMPKFCHCKQTSDLFWLSHEHFDYSLVSISSGAPYADTFQVKIVHRVVKKDTGVGIQMYGGLFFVKETGMKGMLQSKGTNEMKEGGLITMAEIERTLKLISGAEVETQQSKQQSSAESTEGNQPAGSEVDRLKSQNKLLIAALVGVFLLNILLRMIMS